MTMSSSVVLLKFWMDFKLGVWDRKHGNVYTSDIRYKTRPVFPKKEYRGNIVPIKSKNAFIGNSNFYNKLSNKKEKKDIIIDCEVEVINRDE